MKNNTFVANNWRTIVTMIRELVLEEHMKKLALAAPLTIIASMAVAADLPYRAPDLPNRKEPLVTYDPVPDIAFYTGVFVGFDVASEGTRFGGKNEYAACGNAPLPSCDPASPTNAPGGNSQSISGLLGVQIGVDQFVTANIGIGAVADIAALRLSSSSLQTYGQVGDLLNLSTSGSIASRLSTDWLATARLKLTYRFDPQWSVFLSGGLAAVNMSGHTQTSFAAWNANIPGSSVTNPDYLENQIGKISGVRLGYAIGAGAAYNLTSHVSIMAEYLYYSVSANYAVSQIAPITLALSPSTFIAKASASGHLLRMGLNYRF